MLPSPRRHVQRVRCTRAARALYKFIFGCAFLISFHFIWDLEGVHGTYTIWGVQTLLNGLFEKSGPFPLVHSVCFVCNSRKSKKYTPPEIPHRSSGSYRSSGAPAAEVHYPSRGPLARPEVYYSGGGVIFPLPTSRLSPLSHTLLPLSTLYTL